MWLARVLPMLLLTTAANGDFSDTQFLSTPHLLAQLIGAAEQFGEPFASGIRDDEGHAYAYYLKEARYVGHCQAEFGTVHVATFSFVRSGWKDGGPTPPAHGSSFVAFFDATPRLRRFWRVDLPIEGFRLRFDHLRLLLDEQVVFDFADAKNSPSGRQVLFDGKLQPMPIW